MKKIILGSIIAAGLSLSVAPAVSLAEPVDGNCHTDWGDGDTGGCVLGGGGGGYVGGGGGGAGGATCYNYAGPNASCQEMALGYYYSNCSYNCH